MGYPFNADLDQPASNKAFGVRRLRGSMDDQFDELPPSPDRTSLRKHNISSKGFKNLKQSQRQVPRNEADQFKITKAIAKDDQGGNINQYTFNINDINE
tara:strand:- start:52 stop:348 length:297 start_codon:yes stop_codon:yes gene_type:complete